jgi:hypothetical protein
MQTISTSLARCSPGQRDKFLGLALEGMKLFERHGATHTRLLAALTAGQASDVYALTNQFDSAEVPLMRSGPAHHGAVVTANIGHPERGRFEDCCELARNVFEFLEGHGASNCHLLQLDSAGVRTGELLARWEFDSMRSRGKALDAWASDADGQALAARVRAQDSPISITWSGLYRDVHM